jgi:hypothetical protein
MKTRPKSFCPATAELRHRLAETWKKRGSPELRPDPSSRSFRHARRPSLDYIASIIRSMRTLSRGRTRSARSAARHGGGLFGSPRRHERHPGRHHGRDLDFRLSGETLSVKAYESRKYRHRSSRPTRARLCELSANTIAMRRKQGTPYGHLCYVYDPRRLQDGGEAEVRHVCEAGGIFLLGKSPSSPFAAHASNRGVRGLL